MPSKAASKKTASTRRTTTATRTRAKSTSKSTPKATSSKRAKSSKAPAVSVVKEVQPAVGVSELKKRELMDLVVERSDIKKKFAKPVIEAMIEVLGEALAQERPLNLQPMGRVLPQRVKDAGKNRVIITRIRQSKERAKQAATAQADKPPVAKVVK